MEADFYKTYFEVEKDHWWFKVRRNIVLDLLKKLKVDGKVFDFGCGSGFLVGELQKLGYDASGTDTSLQAIEFGTARGVRNLKLIQPSGDLPAGSFDAILALDVIEHIKNDSEAILNLKRALKPDGVLIITVPAYKWLWGVQDEVARHFRRYNMGLISSLVKYDSSFSFIKKTYFNTFLFLPIVIVRLVSKLFKTKGRESDFDINSKLINAIFYFIFNLESKLLNFINFPFGVSILLILRRKK